MKNPHVSACEGTHNSPSSGNNQLPSEAIPRGSRTHEGFVRTAYASAKIDTQPFAAVRCFLDTKNAIMVARLTNLLAMCLLLAWTTPSVAIDKRLGASLARAGNYLAATAECFASRNALTAVESRGLISIEQLPPGMGRDEYLDCLEAQVLGRGESLVSGFLLNARNSRYVRAHEIVKLAQAKGVEIPSDMLVDFEAKREDLPAKERLALLHSRVGEGQPRAQEILADLYSQHRCAAYAGLCSLVGLDIDAAILLIELIVDEVRPDVHPLMRSRLLAHLTQLYLLKARPSNDPLGVACAKARDAAIKGAALGNSCAKRELTRMYRRGLCVAKDQALANKLSESARHDEWPCPVW